MSTKSTRKPVILNDLTQPMTSIDMDAMAAKMAQENAKPNEETVAAIVDSLSFEEMAKILDSGNLTAQVITKEFVYAMANSGGKAQANGFDSMPYLAQCIFYGTCFGTINSKETPKIYEANATKGNANTYTVKVDLNKDSLKSGVSCLNVFGKLNALTKENDPDEVWEVFHKVTKFVREGSGKADKLHKSKMSLYSKFLKIARYMNASGLIAGDNTIKEILSSEPIQDSNLNAMEEMLKSATNKYETQNPEYLNGADHFRDIKDFLTREIQKYKLNYPNAIGRVKKDKKVKK